MLFTLFLVGLFLGSFLTVLGWRLPQGRPVVWGRSRCDHCKRTLAWYELIPVFSYLLAAGRCRHCRTPLSFLYPVSEIACGIGFVLLYKHLGVSPAFFAAALVFCAFFVLCVSDLLYQVLPDGVLIVAALGTLGFVGTQHVVIGLSSAAFFGALWIITRGRGMGLGDVKLAFVLGLLLGYPNIIVALYAAFLTGAGVGVILILSRRLKLKSKIAFGPFLFLGTAIAIIWGDMLIAWWKALL